MGDSLHVTVGKSSGGKVGSIVFGIIFAIFCNVSLVAKESIPFRVIYAILSIGSIPVAVLSQILYLKIYDLIHGGDSVTVYVAKSWFDIIQRRFLGAFVGAGVYCVIIFVILSKMFGINKNGL